MSDCEEQLKLANQKIKELEENEIAFPFRLWLALEEILDKDKSFYHPDCVELRVYDIDFGVSRIISINPKDLICITTDKNLGSKGNTRRKKLLFVQNDSVDNDNKVRTYLLNSNDLNFEKLCNQIDPLSHFLILVSKSTLVNMKFYDLTKKNQLKINLKDKLPDTITNITIPDSESRNATIVNFNKIKEAFNYRVLLQKKVLGYKYSIGIDG
jgi:hypothetical protein